MFANIGFSVQFCCVYNVFYVDIAGDSGHGIMSWFSALLDAADEQFTFPHINVIYPSAPVR